MFTRAKRLSLVAMSLMIASACAPAPFVSPSPSQTISQDGRELLAFAEAYTTLRSDHITGNGYRVRHPSAPIPTRGERVTSAYARYQLLVAMDTEDQIRLLPRTALTRAFIEAAFAAIEIEQRSIHTLIDESNPFSALRPPQSIAPSDTSSALQNEANRLWRELGDQIEDALRSRGLTWPRSRPG